MFDVARACVCVCVCVYVRAFTLVSPACLSASFSLLCRRLTRAAQIVSGRSASFAVPEHVESVGELKAALAATVHIAVSVAAMAIAVAAAAHRALGGRRSSSVWLSTVRLCVVLCVLCAER